MILGNNNTINLAFNALNATNKAIEKTARALSTGRRNATAADDASGLAIGTGISAQIAGVDRAIRNAQDGISLLQTADGGLNQINSMLQRMRELSVQAANDTLTIQDRGYLQNEIDELKANIDNVASNTTFNFKRLLDGSSCATWSSDNASTKLKVSGALTQIDQFGQKKPVEGNYRIEIKARPGQAEVKKTNIFNLTVAEEYTETEEVTTTTESNTPLTAIEDDMLDEMLKNTAEIIDFNNLAEGASGDGWNFTSGTLTLTASKKYSIEGNGTATTNKIVLQSGQNASIYLKDVNIDVSGTNLACAFDITGATADVYLRGDNTLKSGESRAGLEVPDGATLILSSANGDGKTSGSLTATGTGDRSGAGIGGPGVDYSEFNGRAGNITIHGGTINASAGGFAAGIGGGDSDGDDGCGAITITGGRITASGGIWAPGIGNADANEPYTVHDDSITITGGRIIASGGELGAGIGGGKNADSGVIRIRDGMQPYITATGGTDAEDIGKGGESAVISDVQYVAMDEPTARNIPDTKTITTTTETVTHVKTRIREATLAEIPQFYNASSVFMLDEPQTITITQGDGKSADITLYSSDTVSEMAKKINDAIADGLGQAKYADSKEHFCTVADGTSNTSESVRQAGEAVYDAEGNFVGNVERGTLLIRSAIAGGEGRLTFSSVNHDLLNALGLNTIQDASENIFTASVYDAHTGKVIAKDVNAEGNVIHGVISPNASIEFDAMANIRAEWDEGSKRYILVSEGGVYSTTLHVKDESTSFQVGQNMGEDIYLNIGDMRSESLGISGINVLTRDNASKSITLLDAAVHKVGQQRSRIGAYMNELEYNAASLTQSSLHMQESESRINDADMAREYMEFVKLQILNNTGNSMLASSQQNAQSLMNILAQ